MVFYWIQSVISRKFTHALYTCKKITALVVLNWSQVSLVPVGQESGKKSLENSCPVSWKVEATQETTTNTRINYTHGRIITNSLNFVLSNEYDIQQVLKIILIIPGVAFQEKAPQTGSRPRS